MLYSQEKLVRANVLKWTIIVLFFFKFSVVVHMIVVDLFSEGNIHYQMALLYNTIFKHQLNCHNIWFASIRTLRVMFTFLSKTMPL